MPIGFDKRLTQEYCWNIAEAHRRAASGQKYNFRDYQLTLADSMALKTMAKKDAVGLYYNALVSFAQGCNSILAGCVSWACVELYYSIFYALRAELYYRDHVLIRDNGFYLLRLAKDEHPLAKTNKKYNNDHSGTLMFFVDTFEASDYLCSNSISGTNVYLWLMDLRETTNYRHKHFNEPATFSVLSSLVSRIKNDGIANVLAEFKSDFGTYCFSDYHAWLCASYKKLLEVAVLYKTNTENLSADQESYITHVFRTLGLYDAFVKELIGTP